MLDLRELAARYGTPLYVYDLERIRTQARAVRAAFAYEPLTPLYAVKANPCPHVVQAILQEGYGIDCVSPGEVALGLRLGLPPARILYTENSMSDAEMQEAIRLGVTITCNSLERLERLAEAGATACAVRFNPGIGAGAHSKILTAGAATKFGLAPDAIGAVVALQARSALRVVGCHMHIGSGILDASVHAEAFDELLPLVAQLPHLQWVDVGGGFGIPYRPQERELDLPAVGRAIGARMRGLCDRVAAAGGVPRLELRVEPGRYLVAQAGVLLTRVTSITRGVPSEQGVRRTFIGCDTGFNHLVRPAMYEAYHRIDNLDRAEGAARAVDVVGNICETGDVFATDYPLPAETRIGDLLAIRDAGAYGMAMSSTYNLRPLPPEVVVDHDRVVVARERQALDQLLGAWRWPS